MRKVWWGPIYSLGNELLWVAFFLLALEAKNWFILGACLFYIVNYSVAIPKWRRDKDKNVVKG